MKRVIKMAESLRLEYRTKLALAKEEAGEVEAETYIRSLNCIEGQRRLFRNIKVMEENSREGSTSNVTITSNSGETTEYTDKKSMEEVIAPCNENRWHQTEGGSKLHGDIFTSKLGRCGDGPEIDSVLKGNFEFPTGTSDATIEFIDACKLPKDIDIVNNIPDATTRYKIAKIS